MKKSYSTPTIRSENLEIGVFGTYGLGSNGGGWWTAEGFGTWLASWGMCCKNDPSWWEESRLPIIKKIIVTFPM